MTGLTLAELQARAIRDSRFWFPELHKDQARLIEHYAIGLVGEVGELVEHVGRIGGSVLGRLLDQMAELGARANAAKKANRRGAPHDEILLAAGVLSGSDWAPVPPVALVEATKELPDVLIYLLDLAEALGIDLDAALEEKRAVLIERWGNPDEGR